MQFVAKVSMRRSSVEFGCKWNGSCDSQDQ